MLILIKIWPELPNQGLEYRVWYSCWRTKVTETTSILMRYCKSLFFYCDRGQDKWRMKWPRPGFWKQKSSVWINTCIHQKKPNCAKMKLMFMFQKNVKRTLYIRYSNILRNCSKSWIVHLIRCVISNNLVKRQTVPIYIWNHFILAKFSFLDFFLILSDALHREREFN